MANCRQKGNGSLWREDELRMLDKLYAEFSGKVDKKALARLITEELNDAGFGRSEGSVAYKLEMVYGSYGCKRKWGEEETKALREVYEMYKDHRPAKQVPVLVSEELAKMGISRTPDSVRNRINKVIKGEYRSASEEWSEPEVELVEELKERYGKAMGRSNRLAGMIADELKRKGFNKNVSTVKEKIGANLYNKAKERPWTQSDVDVVHWFHQRGCSAKSIASDLNRKVEDVEQMLKMRPTQIGADATIYYRSPVIAWTLR